MKCPDPLKTARKLTTFPTGRAAKELISKEKKSSTLSLRNTTATKQKSRQKQKGEKRRLKKKRQRQRISLTTEDTKFCKLNWKLLKRRKHKAGRSGQSLETWHVDHAGPAVWDDWIAVDWHKPPGSWVVGWCCRGQITVVYICSLQY